MGRDDRGLVDPYGSVFGYPGLYVADGSVMPGPVGPNPSLTIAAVADRFADRMLEGAPEPSRRPARKAGSPEGAPPSGAPTPGAGSVAVWFTEEMKGFLDFEETDYERAFRAGKQPGAT